MTNYNVFNSAIIAALFAFSSQINEISNSFEKPIIVTKKNSSSLDVIDANESLAVVLHQAAKIAIKSCHSLCKTVDESYIELYNSPEELTDELYIMLNSIRDRFLLLDTLFETAISKQGNINSNESDNYFKEVYQNYRITCGKLHRLVSLAKQIKVVPNYFKSDIDFQGLKALKEHANQILSS